MMRKLMIFILSVISVAAYAIDRNMVEEDQIYKQITTDAADAISFQTENRIYIYPEMITITNQGIFVGNVNVPALFSSPMGCWLHRPMNYWFCINPDCSDYNAVYRNNSGLCPTCHKLGSQC
jgi:hypothetical protein